jgi:hypothetical protein
MKVKKLMFSFLAICGMLTGCLSEPDFAPVLEDGIPINLDGSITQVATRVNAQGFEDKDALGLYAVNYENSNQTPGVLLDQGNQADHVKYIFDEASWKWTPVKPVYYKDVNTNVDLYAFYPHAEPSSVSAYNFEVQKDQSTAEKEGRLSGYEASDFLWGKAENVTPTESKIRIQLNHMMAGVQVVLKEGDGFDVAGDWDLLDKKVLVTNTTRKASIDLSTGIVTPIGGPQATGIVMCPQSDASFRAIVVPQTVEAQSPLFSITVGGTSYDFIVSESFTYKAGKLSTVTIKINRKYPSGDYEFVLTDTQIVDWKEDINTHEGEARQYYCVHCEEPGTLGRLIKADKKNPDKIKNLKVSGKISDEDFYFMRDSMEILEAVNLKESKVVDVDWPEWIAYADTDGDGQLTEYCHSEGGIINNVIPPYAFNHKKSLYYVTLPENIVEIGEYAFSNTSITGTLVIPDGIKIIRTESFSCTNISRIELPASLEVIGDGAFSGCSSLSGKLIMPHTILYIGSNAFVNCSFTGTLILPESLEYIGSMAFFHSGKYTGGLRIPDKIKVIKDNAFGSNWLYPFTGTLDLNNVSKIEYGAFQNCAFTGELVIPENVTEIPDEAFQCNKFTSVIFPKSLKVIGYASFIGCHNLMEVVFPEELMVIESEAFRSCSHILSLDLPSTLQSIQSTAFQYCYGISQITCRSVEPPTIQNDSFDGVNKDAFNLEVPSNSVKRYQADSFWGEFRRISAHYDFAISRPISRTLNAQKSKNYILRAPSNHSWIVKSKPDWVSVTPSSGTGKAEVTITFEEMGADQVGTFESEVLDEWGNYLRTDTYEGRAGEIIFSLIDKDYTSTMVVEQYDYEGSDGDCIVLNTATKGDGVDIVIIGDGYDAQDIANQYYSDDINDAMTHYFDVEPYKTYKDYFNVYMIVGESDDSGIGTLNTIRDTKFGSSFGERNLVEPNVDKCFEYACKAPINNNLSQTLIILVQNTPIYGGVCYMYGDGTAIACCPTSEEAYPLDFRGIVQHEAGGHGFGKLADEYIDHHAFISTCICRCCDHLKEFLVGKSLGWYRNLDVTGDMHQVGWSHLIFHPQYSNVVDIYEGGYFHSRGVYRSEPTSCMNNNIPYFSAISRQAIVERIMDYAGEEFNLEDFYANDSDEFGATTRSVAPEFTVESVYNGKQHTPVYMGDKPDFIK